MRTFLLFLIVTLETPGTGFMPSFCIAFLLFFSDLLCLPRAPAPPSSAGQCMVSTSPNQDSIQIMAIDLHLPPSSSKSGVSSSLSRSDSSSSSTSYSAQQDTCQVITLCKAWRLLHDLYSNTVQFTERTSTTSFSTSALVMFASSKD